MLMLILILVIVYCTPRSSGELRRRRRSLLSMRICSSLFSLLTTEYCAIDYLSEYNTALFSILTRVVVVVVVVVVVDCTTSNRHTHVAYRVAVLKFFLLDELIIGD